VEDKVPKEHSKEPEMKLLILTTIQLLVLATVHQVDQVNRHLLKNVIQKMMVISPNRDVLLLNRDKDQFDKMLKFLIFILKIFLKMVKMMVQRSLINLQMNQEVLKSNKQNKYER